MPRMHFASTELSLQIDYGPDEPGMILQRLEREGWTDYLSDGRTVVSPLKVEALPLGTYRLKMLKNDRI